LKIVRVLICILLLGSLVGCMKQIEDTNGDEDFSIVSISDEKICSNVNSYVAFNSYSVENDGFKTVSIKTFSGVDTVDKTVVFNQSLTYNIDLTVKKGNFRLILIKDREIIWEFPLNESSSYTVNNGSGIYELKIAGESAEFSINFSIEII